jgi:Sulfotransferase family
MSAMGNGPYGVDIHLVTNRFRYARSPDHSRPPRSFTSIVCAMLGQHPQMYGLPEVHPFLAETMRERPRTHQKGLLRVVAQLFAEEQTVQTIAQAQRWVNARANRTCVAVFRELAEKVSPRLLVDKSPTTIMRSEYLQRVRRAFPGAKFIHLLRHPRSHGESMRKQRSLAFDGGKPWRAFRQNTAIAGPMAAAAARRLRVFDHSRDWYTWNMNIITFLDGLPEGQRMRVLGEDLLREPDAYLRKIAEWLGLRTDEEAIEAMKHPERSPYACIGPVNAPFGNNRGFLEAPALRRNSPAKELKLEGPLSWRDDGGELSPEVKELAREFGYT